MVASPDVAGNRLRARLLQVQQVIGVWPRPPGYSVAVEPAVLSRVDARRRMLPAVLVAAALVMLLVAARQAWARAPLVLVAILPATSFAPLAATALLGWPLTPR